MLELKQMELTDYEDIKQAVRQSMTRAVVSFVEIGFYLKKIKNEKLYLEDGYKDIWEAAESEFGLKRKQAWSFMNINNKYSVDGNSTELLPQYEGFSKSTLTEMLTLPDEDYELITENTKIEDIRELKQAEQEHEKVEEQVPGQTSIMELMPEAVPEEDKKPTLPELTVEDAIKRLFRPKEMRVLLNNLCSLARDYENYELEYWVESFNPSGNRMEKVIPYFLFFYKYKDGVKIKNIVTQEITNYTYKEFADLVRKLFGSIGCMADYWDKEFGQEEKQKAATEKTAKLNKNAGSEEKEEVKNKEIVSKTDKNKETVSEKPAKLNKNADLEESDEDKKTDDKVETVPEQNRQDNIGSKNPLLRSEEGTPAAETSDEVPEREVISGEVEETIENPVCDIAQKLKYTPTKKIINRLKELLHVNPNNWKKIQIEFNEYKEITEQGRRYIWIEQEDELFVGDYVKIQCAEYTDIPVMILCYSQVPKKGGGIIYGFDILDEYTENRDDEE